MKKKWFDQRAEDGFDWCVVKETVLMGRKVVPPFYIVFEDRYSPRQTLKSRGYKIIGRNMKRKEAEVMAKMLNAVKD